ncbi:hypothetical protein KIPB_012388, partial [Kipferlia bialata]
ALGLTVYDHVSSGDDTLPTGIFSSASPSYSPCVCYKPVPTVPGDGSDTTPATPSQSQSQAGESRGRSRKASIQARSAALLSDSGVTQALASTVDTSLSPLPAKGGVPGGGWSMSVTGGGDTEGVSTQGVRGRPEGQGVSAEEGDDEGSQSLGDLLNGLDTHTDHKTETGEGEWGVEADKVSAAKGRGRRDQPEGVRGRRVAKRSRVKNTLTDDPSPAPAPPAKRGKGQRRQPRASVSPTVPYKPSAREVDRVVEARAPRVRRGREAAEAAEREREKERETRPLGRLKNPKPTTPSVSDSKGPERTREKIVTRRSRRGGK